MEPIVEDESEVYHVIGSSNCMRASAARDVAFSNLDMIICCEASYLVGPLDAPDGFPRSHSRDGFRAERRVTEDEESLPGLRLVHSCFTTGAETLPLLGTSHSTVFRTSRTR